jgi:hypothetical protein
MHSRTLRRLTPRSSLRSEVIANLSLEARIASEDQIGDQ